jgi:arylsulfatase A-like enzyme
MSALQHRSSRALVILACCSLAFACERRSPEDSGPSTDTDPQLEFEPAKTVVLLTVDTLVPRIFFGNDQGWEVAPRTFALLDQGVSFPNTVPAMGITGPSLASITTGTHPHEHRKRTNLLTELKRDTLAQLFGRAGYTTLSYSANQCEVAEVGSDLHRCSNTAELEDDSLASQDAWLIEQIESDLPGYGADEPLFIWVHLNEAHTPFDTVQQYYDEFHPWDYEGDIEPADTDQLDEITLNNLPYDAEDALHVEAAYASGLRQVDDNIGRILDLLESVGRLDQAVLAYSGDHAEELHLHNDYFYHGCSPYTAVYGVPMGFYAPGRIPAGREFDTRVSTVDIAPTLVELSGAFALPDAFAGRSLATGIIEDDLPPAPIYFERGFDTVAVIDGDDKLIISENTAYSSCIPYDGTTQAFETEPLELYDLSSDPDELVNLAQGEPERTEQLQHTLCSWVMDGPWIANELQQADNELVQLCEGVLAAR